MGQFLDRLRWLWPPRLSGTGYKRKWCFLILLAAFELPSAPLTRSPRRRACRSKMRECRDKEKNGRDRRGKTVNTKGVDERDLQVHEIDREAHAQSGVGKRGETKSA